MKFSECFDFSKRLSIYIHIPFCVKKCSYCAFYSSPCAEDRAKQDYTDRIVAEILALNKKMSGMSYYTAFIGGGNPGCLSIRQLEQIAQAVCANGRPREFTIEMNPESLSEEHIFLFKKFFTRLSVGVQSLNERALTFLGRNSTLGETLAGIRCSQQIRRQTGTAVNYDLITCLPTWHNPEDDLKTIISLYQPDHISLYALTLEEGTPLFYKNPSVPDSDTQAIILEGLWNILSQGGYSQYEVSNFAKDGIQSLHNSVYWDYEQYAGIGAGAASTGFAGNRAFRIEASRRFIDWDYTITELSEEEQLEEFVLMGLRHSKGLDLCRLENRFHKTVSVIPKGFFVKGNFLVPDAYGLLTADNAALSLLQSFN